MLMGLFAGMGQTELRWCRRDEFDLNAAKFTHRRNKTGQEASIGLRPNTSPHGPVRIPYVAALSLSGIALAVWLAQYSLVSFALQEEN